MTNLSSISFMAVKASRHLLSLAPRDSITNYNRGCLHLRVHASSRPAGHKRGKKGVALEGNLQLLEEHLNKLSFDLDIDPVATPITEKAISDPPVETAKKTETKKPTSKKEEAPPFIVQRFKSKRRPSFFSPESFQDVGLSVELQGALKTIDITKPSQIQVKQMLLPSEDEFGFRQSLLLADQAGSGKTLAYLLPLIQKLRFEEKELGKKLTTPNMPRALILVPTAELAAQVLDLCRSIAKTCPFRSVALTGGRPWSTQVDFLKEGVDLTICTPKRLLSHLKEGSMKLEKCQTIVIDEVDILLGEDTDFRGSLMEVLQYVLEGTQFFLATATLPDHTYRQLLETFRELTLIVGPGLHCSPPGVVEQLVDCSGGSVINEETGQARKSEALLPLIQSLQEPAQRTVIFCNKIETCRKVENYLKRSDRRESEYVVLSYHAAVTEEKRKENLRVFLRKRETRHVILVASDRASRGLDTSTVSHVILFDFPRDPSEYVRRVGRTARGAEGEGLVSVLVQGRQVHRAKAVLTRSKKGKPIHAVPEE